MRYKNIKVIIFLTEIYFTIEEYGKYFSSSNKTVSQQTHYGIRKSYRARGQCNRNHAVSLIVQFLVTSVYVTEIHVPYELCDLRMFT